ncbi:MAG: ABC transporter substrate-binding protein [Pseudonocardia sp.]
MSGRGVRRAAVLTVGVVVLTACGGGGGPAAPGVSSGFPLTVPSCGRQVTVEKPPERVLTVAADSATAVAAAGAAERVVARSAEGGAPLGRYEAALADVPQLTVNGEPSREAIIGQQVEVVVSYLGLDVPPEDLEAAGIDLVVSAWRCDDEVTFDDVYGTIENYGSMFGTRDVADAAVADLRARVGAVERQFTATGSRTAVNVYIGEDRLSVYGGPSMSDTVMQTLGLTNAFADVNQRLSDVSTEELLARDPDVVLLTFGGSETEIKTEADAIRALSERVPLDRLTAVRENRVIAINFAYLVGGPLTVDGLETLAGGLARLP